jgi:hypothetical protein
MKGIWYMIYQLVKGLSKLTTTTQRINPNILILKFTIVNAFIIGDNSGWVLVDTGLENSYDYIWDLPLWVYPIFCICYFISEYRSYVNGFYDIAVMRQSESLFGLV